MTTATLYDRRYGKRLLIAYRIAALILAGKEPSLIAATKEEAKIIGSMVAEILKRVEPE